MPAFTSVGSAPEPEVKPAPAIPEKSPVPEREEPSPLQPRKPCHNPSTRPRIDPSEPDVETCRMIKLSDYSF